MGYHDEQRRRLEAIIRWDTDLMRLLTAARELELAQWRVVAGCLYQTVWNVLTNKPARTGIRDYDLIYFDDRDLSWEAEDQVVQCVELRMRGLPAPVEVRNQARCISGSNSASVQTTRPCGAPMRPSRVTRRLFMPWVCVWSGTTVSTLSRHLGWMTSSTWWSDQIGR
jgi:Nucleotidyltransferase